MKLANKIAIVTGGGRGIGNGCALELARNGADIVLNDRPGSPDLAAAAEEIRALGRRCEAVEANALTREGCEQLLAAALASFGRVDILISNPACSVRGDFLDFDPKIFEDVIQGTLTAGFHMSQLVARHMVERGGGGKMVFISSVHANRPFGRSSAYNAAKAGLNHLMRTIAAELVRKKINVNAIEPGWIDTPGERATFGDEMIAREEKKLPWERIGQPSDIGKAAAFLCSEDADYITGTILRVDGGFVLRDSMVEALVTDPNRRD
ncbi:MAG: glucose 1-dehydrogenase [Candidatus Binatia bacterium]|jgi:glucose 1-dehydrogenase